MGIDDLLGFADDHLVISVSKTMLREAVTLVKKWCEETNISLNPDKSGILEIPPPRKKCTMIVGSRFEDIPIVDEYKYLGFVIDSRLSGENHMNKLFEWKDEAGKKYPGKLQFIKKNLSSLIKNISLDYRVNLWQILVRPLFIPIALFIDFMCQSSRTLLERKLKKSLKWFLGFMKTVPDDVLFYLVDLDFDSWAKIEVERARLKWKARLEGQRPVGVPKYILKTRVKWLPKEIAQYINLQCKVCQDCGTLLKAEHFRAHGVAVPDVKDLLVELEDTARNVGMGKDKEVCRQKALTMSTELVSMYLKRMISFINK